MRNLQELLDDALKLDVGERAMLAERLLASLDQLTEEDADRLWAEEATSRLEELRSGRAKVVPSSEVHREADRHLR